MRSIGRLSFVRYGETRKAEAVYKTSEASTCRRAGVSKIFVENYSASPGRVELPSQPSQGRILSIELQKHWSLLYRKMATKASRGEFFR